MTIVPSSADPPSGWLSGGAYGAMFVFGIVMALLGAALPMLSVELRFDLAGAGNLFLTMNSAILVSGLGAGPLMDRWGKKPVLIAGSVLVAFAVYLVSAAESYSLLLVSVFVLGVGGAALNSASNVLVADLHDDPSRKNSALNLLGVFFGFGALFLPLTIGSLVKTLGLPAILWVATGLSVAPAFVFAPIRFPAPKEGSGFRLSEAGYVLRNRLLLLFGAVLFFQSGSEFIIGGYASTYLTTELGSSLSTASYALAGYWGCIMAGRVVSSRLLLKLQANTLLRISAIGSALGVAGLILSSDRAFGTLSLVVIGLSFAAIFPTTLGLAANSFGSYLGTVFGLLFAMALTGGMTLPWVVGQVAEVHGLRIGLTLVVGNFLVMLALQVLMARPRQES